MRGIDGKSVIVTGGSSGIGQAIAVHLGHCGANVAVNYVGRPEGAEETVEEIEEGISGCMHALERAPGRTIMVKADVSREGEVRRMFREAVEAFGSLDFLVNNAGVQVSAPSHEMTAEAFDRVVAVNLRGAFLCAREAIAHFLQAGRPGAIVNVSSVHQVIPKPEFVGYAASKGGMENITRTLALEYAGRGIRVNAIGPGATVTPINRAWTDDPAKREMVASYIPMGRAAEAEEMAAVCAFLLSDDAAYITGQTLFVDGGLTLYPAFRTTWSSE